MFLFCLFFLTCQNSLAQKKVLSFSNVNLSTVFQEIEQQTSFVFNYDPASFKDFQYTGKIMLHDMEKALEKLLYETPFIYEKRESTILLYLPEPTSYTLCGNIKDQQSNSSLPLVNIYLEGRNRGTQSDEAGGFEWSFLAYKNQKITFSYVGYKTISRMVQDLAQTDCTDIFLDIDTDLFGGEIIITDYILADITEGSTYSSILLNMDLLNKRQSIVEQDLLKTVQLLPGISSIDESATNLQIRGNSPDQNLVIWEDATLYDPGHVFGMISAINPFIINQVEVYKGVFDPQYDNRVGGIIDLSLNDSIAQGFSGGIGSTLSEGHVFLEIPIIPKKLSYLVAGRKTINGLLSSPTLKSYTSKVFQNSKIDENQEAVEEGDLTDEQQLDYYDYNGKLVFQPTANIRFATSFFKSHNQFNYNSELLEDELASRDRVAFNARAWSSSLEVNLFRKGKTKFGYTSSLYDNNYEISFIETEEEDILQRNEVFNKIIDRTFFITNEWTFTPAFDIQFGYNRNRKTVEFNYIVEEEEEEDNYTDFNFNLGDFNHVFASFNFQKNKFQLNGGGRGTHFLESNNWAFSPRLNIQYAINESLKLKAAAGIFQQYISQLKQFGENELGINNPIWVLNADEVDGEYVEAKKVSAGFVFHKAGWLLDMEGYLHQQTGLSTLTPTLQVSTDFEEEYFNGSSTSTGIDILLRKKINNYTAWLNYSLHHSTFLFLDFSDTAFPTTNDQRHILAFVNNWKYKNWTFSASYQFKSGLPYSEPSDVEEVEEEESGDIFYQLVYENFNQKRLPTYSRLDIGINYRPTFSNLPFQPEINFSIINLLNRENLFSRDFLLFDLEETTNTRPDYFNVERRLLKRTPLFSLRVYW